MALQDHLTEEKAALTALLESEYANQNMRDSLLQRLYYIRFLLGELSSTDGGGGNVSVTSSVLPTGAAISALQSNVQADAGSDATKAITVQGVTNGKAIPISGSITANAGTNLNTSALALESGGNLAGISSKLILPTSLGQKTAANSLAVTLATDGVASGIATQIGEVQASPTANTVLARLKSIADALVSGIKTAVNSFSISKAQEQFTETQLTAPNSTASRSMAGYTNAFIQVVIASINTNVVLRVEGSNDGTNWANLSVSNSDTVITSNGTQGFMFSGCPQFIRTTFVSESGGTNATIDVITRLSA